MKIAKFIEMLFRFDGDRYSRGEKDSRPNERGNEIIRLYASTDRYVVDFADDFTSEGWMQFDTDQDAHYFGVWVNPSKLLKLSYAEGDWTLVVCPDAVHYNAEVEAACEFYGEGRIARVIDMDAKTITDYRQDRAEFFRPEVQA